MVLSMARRLDVAKALWERRQYGASEQLILFSLINLVLRGLQAQWDNYDANQKEENKIQLDQKRLVMLNRLLACSF